MVCTNLYIFYEKLFGKTFSMVLPFNKNQLFYFYKYNESDKIKIMLTDCDRETSKKKDFRNR